MKLAKKCCQDFFLDNLGQPYVAVKIESHLEVLPIKSSRFKNWLCKMFYDYTSERNKVRNEGQSTNKIHFVEDVEKEKRESER